MRMRHPEGVQISAWLVIIYLTRLCTSKTFSFDDNPCSVSSEYINDDIVYVTYDGGDFTAWCNSFSFVGRDSDNVLNEYTICVTPVFYEDPDCAISVEYKSFALSKPEKKFTCNNQPVRWCGKQNDYLYIALTSEKSNTSNARFKLKLEAEKTFDYGVQQGIIAGGVLGSLALICLVVGLVGYLYWKRRNVAGSTVSMTNYNPTNYIQGNPTGTSQPPPGSYPQQPVQPYGQSLTSNGQPPTS